MKKILLIIFFSFGFIFLLPDQADASIGFVASASWEETGATSYTRAFNNIGTANDMLVVGVGVTNNNSVTVTYNGDDVALRHTVTTVDSFTARIFAKDGSLATGSNNLVIGTYSGNSSIAWGAMILSGASGFGSTPTTETQSGAGVALADIITTESDNSWHIALLVKFSTATISSADTTIRIQQANTTTGATIALSTDLVATAGVNTATFTYANNGGEAGIASLEIKEGTSAPVIKKQSEIFF